MNSTLKSLLFWMVIIGAAVLVWNFCGSLRNSMISCSSSLASSTPATSLKVTFFCAVEESLALLLPNESALLPPLCIWRIRKIQKPIMSRIGAQEEKISTQGLSLGFFPWISTPFFMSSLARPSYWAGAKVRKLSSPAL